MIAVDTNLLVYASREDSSWHAAARRCLVSLAESGTPWAIPWPCLHEFLAIVTHPRIFRPPTPMEIAVTQVDAWIESPSVALLAEDAGYWETFRELVRSGSAVGPRVHDARIATICVQHGVDVLWTADRDFTRFGALRVRNPLIDPDAGGVQEREERYRRRRRAR